MHISTSVCSVLIGVRSYVSYTQNENFEFLRLSSETYRFMGVRSKIFLKSKWTPIMRNTYDTVS